MSDVDDFGTRSKSYLSERKQYRFEEKVLRQMVKALHDQSGLVIQQLRRLADNAEGLTFWQFHQAFSFPMALTGYKMRRVNFLKALRHPEKTPLWTAWSRHTDNYEQSEFTGMFYESIGDGMPIMLLHNCPHMPLISPHWRCQTAVTEGLDDVLYFEPLKGALEAFIQMGWTLEGT